MTTNPENGFQFTSDVYTSSAKVQPFGLQDSSIVFDGPTQSNSPKRQEGAKLESSTDQPQIADSKTDPSS